VPFKIHIGNVARQESMKEKLTGNLKRTVKENLENTVKIIKLKEAYL